MQKKFSLTKKLKKQFLSINDSIESYFNSLGRFITNFRKTKLSTHNKVFLGLGLFVLLCLSYLLVPTLYNKDNLRTEIKNQIFDKYNINLKFDKKINYALLPRPHFVLKNSSIYLDNKIIGKPKNFKIFISIDKLFFFKSFEVRDLIIDTTDFNVTKDDLNFFLRLLNIQPSKNKIVIKNSNIFLKNKEDEVLLINKIINSEFYYDLKNLQNIFMSKNEIFNIPFKLKIKNDKFNKKIISEFNSKKIRLNIDNESNYKDENIKGLVNVLFVSKNTSFNYEIKKNSLNFKSSENKNSYNGQIFFKPFYFNSNIFYEGISVKNLFDNKSIIVDLIKTEILNNKNLNIDVLLKVKDITNINELKNLNLKFGIEEGDISFSDSTINWKDDLKLTLVESLLDFENGQIYLSGKINLKFYDIQNFYKTFQIKRDIRKDVKNIELDFVYNFDQKKISFDNVKLDDKSNTKLENYINRFNLNDRKILNKVTFKNFVNNFFEAYAG